MVCSVQKGTSCCQVLKLSEHKISPEMQQITKLNSPFVVVYLRKASTLKSSLPFLKFNFSDKISDQFLWVKYSSKTCCRVESVRFKVHFSLKTGSTHFPVQTLISLYCMNIWLHPSLSFSLISKLPIMMIHRCLWMFLKESLAFEKPCYCKMHCKKCCCCNFNAVTAFKYTVVKPVMCYDVVYPYFCVWLVYAVECRDIFLVV